MSARLGSWRRHLVVLVLTAAVVAAVSFPAEAAGTELVLSGQGISVNDVTPDGRYVVYTTGPSLVGADPVTQTINVVDTRTGSVEKIWSRTALGTVRLVPRISDDGRWVVHGGGGGGIVVYDRTSGTEEAISLLGVPGEARDSVISGDGRYIAFSAIFDIPGIYYGALWVYDRTTGEHTRIAGPEANPVDDWNFVNDISSDGRLITFNGDDTGYVHDQEIGSNQRLTPVDGLDTSLLISGDGTRVAYRSLDNVYTRLRSGGPVTLLKLDANVDSISDDGRYVSFTSWGEGDGGGVFVTDTRTGTRTRVAPDVTGGVVAGDGSVIFFTSGEVLAPGGQAGAANLYSHPLDGSAPVGSFDDTGGHVFDADISWLAAAGITRGCNPPANSRFCPDEPVTRGQMAAFLNRALGLATGTGTFVDTTGHIFAADVAALATAGVTRGCNPPTNDRFCPDEPVTRGQMAAFLHRALPQLDLVHHDVAFTDTPRSVFSADIDWLAATGVTKGCNPPANDRFCPDGPVTRGQMAAFLHRALG